MADNGVHTWLGHLGTLVFPLGYCVGWVSLLGWGGAVCLDRDSQGRQTPGPSPGPFSAQASR